MDSHECLDDSGTMQNRLSRDGECQDDGECISKEC